MPKLSPKDITSSFVQHGYYLRPDGLKTLKLYLKGKDKKIGKSILHNILTSVSTVIESNAELADGQFVNSTLVEHALKLLPTNSSAVMEEEGLGKIK